MAFFTNISSFTTNYIENKLFSRLLIFIALAVSIIFVFIGDDVTEFPVFVTDSFTFTAWVNHGEDY